MFTRLFVTITSLCLGVTALAEPRQVTRVLRDTTTMVAIPINTKTAFCNDRGYGMVVLKVSVPDLEWLGHFDHRVEGEGVPCITAGRCSNDLGPESIINSAEPLAVVPLRVTLTDNIVIDEEKKTCSHSLQEHVTSLIRGQVFQHDRYGMQSNDSLEACLKLEKL